MPDPDHETEDRIGDIALGILVASAIFIIWAWAAGQYATLVTDATGKWVSGG